MPERTVETWVLVVDDDPIVLAALRQYFSSTDDIRIVAEATNGVEALTLLNNVSVDVVLADIHMPEMDGVTLLREIQRRSNPPAFVAITALDADDSMLKVLAGGGVGYIIKSARPQEIISAVREAADGGTTVSPQAMTRLVDYIPAERPPEDPVLTQLGPVYAKLTGVEKRVLGHLCEGLSNAEIAHVLNYSEATVKKHVSQLIGQFGVSSRLSLAVTAIRSGFSH